MSFKSKLLALAALALLAVAPIAVSPAEAQSSSCRATTAAPTYTANTLNALSCDLSGNLRSTEAAGGVGSVNISQVGGATVTAFNPASSVNYLPVVEPDELGFTGTVAATVSGAIPISVNGGATALFIDMQGFESVSVQITSAGVTTTLSYETSDDSTNWLSTTGISADTRNVAANITSNTTGLNTFPKRGRYFRVRVSTAGTGTVTFVGNLHKNPQPLTNRITVDGPQANNTVPTSGITAMLRAQNVAPSAGGNNVGYYWTSSLVGAGVVRPYSIPELDQQQTVNLANNTSTQLFAAGGAGVKNYLTAAQLSCTATGVANTIQILRGATVIWGPHNFPAAEALMQLNFPTPLQTAAAEALNVQLGVAPVGTCQVSGQGYSAAD